MGETLNDVLAMHQIEEGTFTMRRAPFVVSDLISGAIAVVAVELVVWGAFRYRTRNRDFSAQ